MMEPLPFLTFKHFTTKPTEDEGMSRNSLAVEACDHKIIPHKSCRTLWKGANLA